MSVRATRFEGRLGVMRGMPAAADLADLWLVHALTCLLDACDVPEPERLKLIGAGIDDFESKITSRSTATQEVERLARLDACSLALVFAALALEARINRALRACDPAEWRAVSHLTPAEKFRLAPRLLDELDSATEDAELCRLVVEVFDMRDDLVDAGGSPRSEFHIGPSVARAMVEASAKVCSFLATLTGGDESGTALRTQKAAEALTHRADALALARPPTRPDRKQSSNGDADFPPDLPEW